MARDGKKAPAVKECLKITCLLCGKGIKYRKKPFEDSSPMFSHWMWEHDLRTQGSATEDAMGIYSYNSAPFTCPVCSLTVQPINSCRTLTSWVEHMHICSEPDAHLAYMLMAGPSNMFNRGDGRW